LAELLEAKVRVSITRILVRMMPAGSSKQKPAGSSSSMTQQSSLDV
jgi:hypothetical protein